MPGYPLLARPARSAWKPGLRASIGLAGKTMAAGMLALGILLFSAQAAATPISFRIPLTIEALPPSLFTQVRVTGYSVGDQATPTPIPQAPALRQGESYTTPMLDFGDRGYGETFTIRLFGELRARNRMEGGEDVIVPFRIRARVYLSRPFSGDLSDILSRVETDHMVHGLPLAQHIELRLAINNPVRFDAGAALNQPLRLRFTAASNGEPALTFMTLM